MGKSSYSHAQHWESGKYYCYTLKRFCDFLELYRYMIDDFLIEYCRNINPKDFSVKAENIGKKKEGKTRVSK